MIPTLSLRNSVVSGQGLFPEEADTGLQPFWQDQRIELGFLNLSQREGKICQCPPFLLFFRNTKAQISESKGT